MTANRLAGLALAFTVLVPSAAQAYICSRADDNDGAALSWFSREVSYTFFAGGTSDINGEDEFDAIRDAFAVWESLVTGAGDSCQPASATTDFRWTESPTVSVVDRIGYDFISPGNNENLVLFRDEGWPYPGREDTDLALATVTFNRVTGEILDSDMEFNTANSQFTVRNFNPITDLLNTAVHEIGHLMGLAHTTDVNASMFGSAAPGEVKKRDLNCDDFSAMIFKYPSNAANGYCTGDITQTCGFCQPPGEVEQELIAIQVAAGEEAEGGCAATPASPWLVLVALGLIRRRRSS